MNRYKKKKKLEKIKLSKQPKITSTSIKMSFKRIILWMFVKNNIVKPIYIVPEFTNIRSLLFDVIRHNIKCYRSIKL